MKMHERLLFIVTVLSWVLLPASHPAHAFCGFYVAKADAKLFNKASKVVIAHKGEQTAVTMASDFQGNLKEFALVVPMPTVPTKNAIKIIDNAVVDDLDAYSAPRLVEYFDPDPCASQPAVALAGDTRVALSALERQGRSPAVLGVSIEAQYTVGEYDILILSAMQSSGLAEWLNDNGYRVPPSAVPVLASYIRQGMKFFVARVNLQEQERLGYQYLRPIQVNFETTKFMLPIRLGTVNADGPQDMIVLMLTEKGRVEPTNYRSTRIPSNVELPVFTRANFGKVYRAIFDEQVKKDDMRVVYLEYAWDTGWCDPCVAAPLASDKLVSLGAFWISQSSAVPAPAWALSPARPTNLFLTRLHVRYDAEHFPEDLMFQETADRTNFQGRYILRHPFRGRPSCAAGERYRRSLGARLEREAAMLSSLTGWGLASIRQLTPLSGEIAK